MNIKKLIELSIVLDEFAIFVLGASVTGLWALPVPKCFIFTAICIIVHSILVFTSSFIDKKVDNYLKEN